MKLEITRVDVYVVHFFRDGYVVYYLPYTVLIIQHSLYMYVQKSISSFVPHMLLSRKLISIDYDPCTEAVFELYR